MQSNIHKTTNAKVLIERKYSPSKAEVGRSDET